MVWACAVKKDNDWVKKCMKYEVEVARPRGRPKKTWRSIEQESCAIAKMFAQCALYMSALKVFETPYRPSIVTFPLS